MKPPPLTDAAAPVSFRDLGVPIQLVKGLERRGISAPFPIQAATLPDALAGRDVCGMAPTGSGKTLAFGLAVLSRLASRQRASGRGRRHPSALVLAPTRELAAQIEAELSPLAAACGARTGVVYGGVGYGAQVRALHQGVDVLVACPGRLADLIERGSVELGWVDMVVVDEADRMADMGFLPAVRRLINLTSKPRQTLLFSATLDGPVDTLIREYQHDPVRFDVDPGGSERGEVHHRFWRVESTDRVSVTAGVVSVHGAAMVFCRTKRGTDRLSDRLSRSGLRSAAIHGDRSQSQRDRALAAFRAGQLDVLVATDVAARGIHVDAVPLVVNFDPPAGTTDYVHRAGRTGRAGADGLVVSMLTGDQITGAKVIIRELQLTSGISAPDESLLSTLGVGTAPAPPTDLGPGRSQAPVERNGQRPTGRGASYADARPGAGGKRQRNAARNAPRNPRAATGRPVRRGRPSQERG